MPYAKCHITNYTVKFNITIKMDNHADAESGTKGKTKKMVKFVKQEGKDSKEKLAIISDIFKKRKEKLIRWEQNILQEKMTSSN